ncbi:MAG: alginate lyase family protein [Sphingobacteriaceae bacterium]|nr:alginate lyase family protein [Cytophagaceae bacterium]
MHKGPNKDIEWAYFLNRMNYFESLLSAYCQTGNPVYAGKFNQLLLDWITSNPAPENQLHNAPWRVLEVGLRLFGPWPTAFYGFQQTPAFTPLARLLMLMSIQEQAVYVRKFHWEHHNHGVMELNGLTRIALCFPEFKQADAWYQHALVKMAEEFRFQSYPDGAMKELTSSYHWVVVRNFLAYLDLHKIYRKPLSPKFSQIVENMCNYMAYTARPDGYGLLNNDADLLNNFEILKPLLSDFPRSDWRYLFTHGKEGRLPPQTSLMFPWAGQFVMRNGWGETKGNEHFAYFDVGPWGTSHQHNDKLHLSVYANGREILCDAGRMYYKVDKWRQFVNLSAAHNVISLNGRGQDKTQPEATVPVPDSSYNIQPGLDFCIGTYQGGFGDQHELPSLNRVPPTEKITGRHTRAVLYLKNKYWVVVDQVESDRPLTVTAYWHFAPACTVMPDGPSVKTVDVAKGNLRIAPVSTLNWAVEVIKGQETPTVQGWYSERYNQRVAAACAEYKAQMAGTSSTFAWILHPSADEKVPAIASRVLPAPPGAFRMEVRIPGEKPVEIAVNMHSIQDIPLSDGSVFTGRCVVVQEGQKPQVVWGKFTGLKNSPSIRN